MLPYLFPEWEKKLLGIPKLDIGTGKAFTQAVHNAL